MPIRAAVNLPARGLPDTLDRRTVRTLIARAVRTTLRSAEMSEGEVSVTLLDDAHIAAMNAEYLEHDGPTDVISFALHDDGAVPLGDVYIGYEQAARQARAHRIALEEELTRLAVHGTLHVLGFDHAAGEARTRGEMWRLQEEIVERVLHDD